MGTSTIVVPRTYRGYTWDRGDTTRSYPQPPGLWLPSTNYIAAKIPWMNTEGQINAQIHPRPDAEIVNPYAWHKTHYYDGVNTLTQRIPIQPRGGCPPYNFVIMAAPAAANARMGTSQWAPGWTIWQAIYGGYGDLLVSPTGSYTDATFWVRAYSQDGTYLDFIWTASTTSSTNAFIFLDPLNGVDTNTGAYGAPIKTLLQAFGAANGDTTYPNANLILFGTANIPLYAQDAVYGISPVVNATPLNIIGFDGQNVTLDQTNAGSSRGFNIQTSDDDLYWGGFTMINGPYGTGTTNYSPIASGALHSRMFLQNISCPNIFQGSDPTDNASFLAMGDPTSGYPTCRNYIWMKGCSETNRPLQSGGNGFGMFDWYKVQYGGASLCSVTGNGSGYAYFIKGGCLDITVQHSLSENVSGQYAMASFCQTNNVLPWPQNFEFCFNTIVSNQSLASYGTTAAAISNLAYFPCGQHWWYRNSIIGGAVVDAPSVSAMENGPFEYDNNAIQFGAFAAGVITSNSPSLPLPSNVTNNGALAQDSTGVFDSNWLLTGTYRADYLGVNGAEIAP